jgi:hypothetical protein
MSCQDSIADEAFREVAELLAVAYARYSRVRRVPVESAQAPVNKDLDVRRDLCPHVNCG